MMLSKLQNEQAIVKQMILIHCNAKHSTLKGELCAARAELLDYFTQRLVKCPLRDNKPKCRNCHIHCYKKDMRVLISGVMRFSGPRILFYSPFGAFRYLFGI